jgi:WD40 repeat protein
VTDGTGWEVPQGRGRWILASSSATEYAFEGDTSSKEGIAGSRRRSLFTAAVIDGLRSGAADVDADGLVSVSDLYRYVSERVAGHGGKPQLVSDAVGELYLARSRTAPAPAGQPVPEAAAGDAPSSPAQGLVLIRVLDGSAPLAAVAIGYGDNSLLTVAGCEDGTVCVWDLMSGDPSARRLVGHSGPVWGVATGSIDGRPFAVSGSDDGTVRVWDLATGSLIGSPLTGHTAMVNAVAAGQAGGRPIVASGSDDNTVRVWDAATGSPLVSPLAGHTNWVNGVALSSDASGRTVVVSGSTDQTVRVFDLDGGVLLRTLTGHTDSVSCVAATVLADGRSIVVSGSADETIRVFDLNSGQLLRTLTGHSGRVRAVTAGALEKRPVVVSGGDDHTVRVWDLADELRQPSILRDHVGAVRGVAIGVLASAIQR